MGSKSLLDGRTAMAVDLSVIIPSLGNTAELESCLLALNDKSARLDFEIIVVDSSANPHVEDVTQRFPAARLIRSQDKLFPGAARNLGVRHARSKKLAFVDADCIPSKDWIQQAFASTQREKITGGPILNLQHENAIQWADNQLQFSSFRAGRNEGFAEHLPSCNLVMERATLQSLGGFDEHVATGEDALFSARVAKIYPRGLWFNPRLIITHRGRATLRGFLAHQNAMGYHRGWLHLAFTPAWAWLSRSPLLAVLAVCRRFAFTAYQTWKYNRKEILLFMLYSPILLLGLIAWTAGFYAGVARRNSEGEP